MLQQLVTKYLILVIFAVSSVAGLAHLLWEGKPLPTSKVVGACILSGIAGTVVFLLLYDSLTDRPHFLAGVSILSGIGGASTLQFLTEFLKKRLNLENDTQQE